MNYLKKTPLPLVLMHTHTHTCNDLLPLYSSTHLKPSLQVRRGSGEGRPGDSGRNSITGKRYILVAIIVAMAACVDASLSTDMLNLQKATKELLSSADVVLATNTGASADGPLK